MATWDIVGITPGSTKQLDITVDVPTGATVTGSTLKIAASEGASALITKTITAVSSASGIITDPASGGTALLTFKLSTTDTGLLTSGAVHYVYSVQIVTDLANTLYSIPVGRLYTTYKV